jgi:hypothetical protein
LPKAGTARFLWDTPLFAFEGKELTLHLGLPDGPSAEEIDTRYREMVFGGLDKIYLYCAENSGEQFLETLRSRYANVQATPVLERIASS